MNGNMPGQSTNKRQTMWPSATSYEDDIELIFQWPLSRDEANQRVVSIFDTDARAARLSVLVNDQLMPPPRQARNRHSIWTGATNDRRETWLGRVKQSEVPARVWNGEFDVEKRPSWMPRTPSRWSEGKDFEKYDESLDFEKAARLVQWKLNDPENPLEFATGRRWFNAMLLAFACFMVSIASSGFSQGTCVINFSLRCSR